MINVSAAQLSLWISTYFWPFVRIAACLMFAPVFGSKLIPHRVRLVVAGALTVLLAPLIAVPAKVELFSCGSLVVTLQEMLIGAAMGFTLQIIFDAVEMAGQLLANSMGLSFAMSVDPLHGTSTPVLGQFYTIMVTLTSLALNGHLLLIESITQSFSLLPIGMTGLGHDGLWMLVNFGGTLFSGALMLALPGLAAMLIVNFGFGVMSRAAPTMNLFAVGFPAALALGLIVILLGLSSVQNGFMHLVDAAMMMITSLVSNQG